MHSEIDSIDSGVRVFRDTPDAMLLDVRSAEEYAEGHIPGSINVPLERLSRFDSDSEILFVYCRSGNRSARAAAMLNEMDYNALNIGGIQDYTGELEV